MKEFGFTITDRPIMVDDIRARGSGKSGIRTTAKAQTGSQPPKVTQVKKKKKKHSESVNRISYHELSGLLTILLKQSSLYLPFSDVDVF